jgi:hypothetical protein
MWINIGVEETHLIDMDYVKEIKAKGNTVSFIMTEGVVHDVECYDVKGYISELKRIMSYDNKVF